MKVLVTGGAGYIGSHTVVELLENGYEVVICDDLSNSNKEVVKRIEKITEKKPHFFAINLTNKKDLESVFKKHKIDAVIHFAGYKAVGESCEKPLEYYQNNLISTMNLIEIMRKYKVNNFVFSSSATVYGNPKTVPVKETSELTATNPYGRTKLFIEYMLKDFVKANKDFNVALLRYFNPIGAHKSGLIGEDPNGIPNNLLPYIQQVAIKKREKLYVFGNDYKTHDGTGVRDYIHVCDLARGHVLTFEKLKKSKGLLIYNLGTGKGYSVLDVVKAFEKATGMKIPYEITARRPGDIDECYADVNYAKKEIGFVAKYNMEDMCRDGWNWQKKNPNGYKGA